MLELDQSSLISGTKIKIIGVGGAGGNAVNTMIENGLRGVEFIAANTDASDLKKSKANIKIQLGKKLTKGLGSGADPEIGKNAALESEEDVKAHLEGTDMLFIAAGIGKGTGTGAAPVIAKYAREMDILTLAIVCSPFEYEGNNRRKNFEDGIKELHKNVDTFIVIPNQKLTKIYNDLTVINAFKKSDEVLYHASKAVSDIINLSGFINVDFADVKSVMSNKGYSLMGMAVAEGENKAVNAAKAAISNPLLEDINLDNCKAVIINTTVGYDVKLQEYEEVNNVITNETGKDANIITGLIVDENYEGKIGVTIIATGLSGYLEDSVLGEKSPPGELAKIIEIKAPPKTKPADLSTEKEVEEVIKRIKESSDSYHPDRDKEQTHSSKYIEKTDIPAFLRKFTD